MQRSNLHASFVLAAEYREKIRRTKEDFGAPGLYISVETMRGVYDFPVRDEEYFEKFSPASYDVLLIAGRAVMRVDRLALEAVDFTVCDNADALKQAERFFEAGELSAVVKATKRPYPDRLNGKTVPRVDLSAFGFHDQIVDEQLFSKLPDEGLYMNYIASVSLEVAFEKRATGLTRRNQWLISDQRLSAIKREPRPAAEK